MLPESHAGLLKLFKMLDTDGNGVISLRELQYELALFGLNEEQISRFLHEFDLNGDQEITLEEFKFRLNIPSNERSVESKRVPRIGILKTSYEHPYTTIDIRISSEEKPKEISDLWLKNHAGLTRLFNMLDTDRNGVISLVELKNELALFGFSQEQISYFLREFDLNGDQQITLEEYKLRLTIPFKGIQENENDKQPRSRERVVTVSTNSNGNRNTPDALRREIAALGLNSYSSLLKLFDLLDPEGDGVITVVDLRIELALFGLNDKQIWRFLQDLDMIGEEEITLEEYKRRLNRLNGFLNE